VGDYLSVQVTESNLAGEAQGSSALTAQIVGPPHAGASAPVISGPAGVGRTLSSSTGAWSGGTPTAYAYQWQRDSGAGSAFVPIEGATSSSYTATEADASYELRVVATASDLAGEASATSAPTGQVVSAPQDASPGPSISGVAGEGQELSATTGTFAGAGLSYSYQWQDCVPLDHACAGIAGATSASYALTASDVGYTVRVLVTATNAAGSA
jgi:hypothetical protein